MAFPAAFIDELIVRNPIEDVVSQYVELKRKGGRLFGLCPFHGEKTASFSVSPDAQLYYCFGCHKGGGVINFIMDIEGLSYPDAVRFLANRAGLEVPEDEAYRSQYKLQERLWALCRDAARYYRRQLFSPEGKQAVEYIVGRGLSRQTVTNFGLGFAPPGWSGLLDAMKEMGYSVDELMAAGLALRSQKSGGAYDRFRNRLMFPIIDIRGNVIGFGGRVMDDSTPKYLNSPESTIFNKRKNLFAMNVAKKSKLGYIILTEGYMDAIALHQYGFDSAVASLGTALTEEHANLLSKYTEQIVLTYDSDEAGQNATRRAVPILEKAGLKVKILRMEGAKDPDEFLKKFGADRFRLLLERSENHAEYQLQTLERRYDLSLDEQRVAFLSEAAQMIAGLPSAIEREVYGARAAQSAGITPEAMKIEVNKARGHGARRPCPARITLDPLQQSALGHGRGGAAADDPARTRPAGSDRRPRAGGLLLPPAGPDLRRPARAQPGGPAGLPGGPGRELHGGGAGPSDPDEPEEKRTRLRGRLPRLSGNHIGRIGQIRRPHGSGSAGPAGPAEAKERIWRVTQ